MLRISVFLPILISSIVCFSFGQDVTFKPSILPSHGAAAVQADLNGDGILDFISPGPRSDFNKNGFYVMLSNSDGTYQAPVFYTSPYPGDSNVVAIADFNGDGKHDVVAVEGTKGYYIFLNNGKGQLLPSWNFATRPGDSNHGVVAGDFNHDGQTDLVILADQISSVQLEMLVGKGNGTFSAPIAFDSNAAGGNLVVGDFDDDGNADLATLLGPCQRDVGCFTRIRVYYGDGKAGFSAPTVVDYDKAYAFMVSNDVNQDGHSDLIGTSGQGVLPPVVRILFGTSRRTTNG